MIKYSEFGLIGIVWISVCIYVVLTIVIPVRFRKYIALIFAIGFIIGGVIMLMTSDDNHQSF